MLVLDDTGFLKTGRHSAGVARQYRGTVGNCGQLPNRRLSELYQPAGPGAGLDRELYLPQKWTDDRERCRQAGIPEDRRFATKPQLAQQMLARAFAAGGPAPWSRATASRAMTAACGGGWKPSPTPMSWRSRARHTSGGTGGNGR